MKRTLALALAVSATLPLAACNNKSKPHNRSTAAAVTSQNDGGLPGLPNGNFNIGDGITSATPNTGSPAGGDAVTLAGRGFVAGLTVEFGGVAATDIMVVSGVQITCKTPAHAAGLVDITITKSGGAQLRLTNGFEFDPNAGGGAMARVADHGDPSGEEQELIELMQRARRDPAAEGARLNAQHGTTLNFAGYARRQPLSPNGFLMQAASKHTSDMASQGFYAHVNPTTGDNANGRIIDSTYALNSYFGTNRTINLTENIGKGTGAAPGNLLTTPQGVHDAFMIDAGVVGTKHRQQILGNGQFALYREVGPSYLHRAPSDYIDEEFAYTATDKPFVLGVAFDDRNGDGVAQAGEGTPSVTVTLSHASGFSISTQTRTAGGFSFEVFVAGTYTLTIDGKSTQVTVAAENQKVDLRGGQVTTY